MGGVLCAYNDWLTSFMPSLETELAFEKEQQLVGFVPKLKCMHQKRMQIQQVVLVYRWRKVNNPESMVLGKNTPYR